VTNALPSDTAFTIEIRPTSVIIICCFRCSIPSLKIVNTNVAERMGDGCRQAGKSSPERRLFGQTAGIGPYSSPQRVVMTGAGGPAVQVLSETLMWLCCTKYGFCSCSLKPTRFFLLHREL